MFLNDFAKNRYECIVNPCIILLEIKYFEITVIILQFKKYYSPCNVTGLS